MKNKISTTKAFLLALCFAFPFVTFSQDGSLDLTFDNDGIVNTSLIGFYTPEYICDGVTFAVTIQADGKIVTAGSIYALARYNTNGSLDNTFGTAGIVMSEFEDPGSGQSMTAYSIAIQADGKILSAGTFHIAGWRFGITRRNTDGSLDNTFGTAGIVLTSIGNGSGGSLNSRIFDLAIQADGKIVVAGEGNNYKFALARYNTDGSLDNTFGTAGIVTFNNNVSGGKAVKIQSDGKIVVLVEQYISSQSVFALTRHNTNGSLDLTFSGDGVVTTAIGLSSAHAKDLAIQGDGKIVVAGDANGDFALTRYNTNGSLDITFGTAGIVTTNIYPVWNNNFECPNAISIQADGKIVAAGYSNYGFTLARYKTNGNIDNTFGTAGIVATPDVDDNYTNPHTSGQAAYDFARAIAIQADGKIVAVGDYISYGDELGNGVMDKPIKVVRYNNSLTGDISENSNNTSQISIYPNPFSNTTTLKTDNLFENATFIVYNTLGEQVRKIDNITGQTFTFYRENLDEGIYFYHLKENNKMLSVDKLIICD